MSRGRHTKTDKATPRKTTQLSRPTTHLDGTVCPLCGGRLRTGDKVTVADGRLVHRAGECEGRG